MLSIGPHKLSSNLLLAPMAGISDLPFRTLCESFGAGLAVSEMLTSDSRLWHTTKSSLRLKHSQGKSLTSMQIAGFDPVMMAQAARLGVEKGADIIDINMGCPAKKVCNRAAGSALLRDEKQVEEILTAVVSAVEVPVTLKIRTGWCKESRNALRVAQIAEQSGIQALVIHGRTRACRFMGEAEYESIAQVKQNLSIPVIANGDINSAKKAQFVLDYTGADAIMLGRAAQGQPWIFKEIIDYLRTGSPTAALTIGEASQIILRHISELHRFYGEFLGTRIARKHMGWYFNRFASSGAHFSEDRKYRSRFNGIENANGQIEFLKAFFVQFDGDSRLAA